MLGRRMVRGLAVGLVALSLSSASVVAAPPGAAVPSSDLTTVRIAKIPIPGKPLTSFDISWGDGPTAHYYLGDRSNGAIDVVNIQTNEVTGQIGGFVGFRGSNDTSGPN